MRMAAANSRSDSFCITTFRRLALVKRDERAVRGAARLDTVHWRSVRLNRLCRAKTPVAGISIGLVSERGEDQQIKRYELLTDIIGSEDHFGDMDFKICGTEAGITGFQLDLKLPGLSHKIITEAIQRAKQARTKILEIMRGVLEKPRTELSPGQRWAGAYFRACGFSGQAD